MNLMQLSTVRERFSPVFSGTQPQRSRSNHPVKLPQQGDIVQFRGKGATSLAEKYGIDPQQVDLIAQPGVTLPVSKEELLERLLQAHEHGKKNRLLGNFSGHQYASNLLLENGRWALGTNIELTRDLSLCGERSALINGWNRALEDVPEGTLDNPENRKKAEQGLTVKLFALTTGRSPTDPKVAICSECQSWMATERYFSPDTLLTNLGQNEKTGRYFIQVRAIKDLLPLLSTQQPSRSEQAIATLPLRISDAANAVLRETPFSRHTIHNLVEQAQAAYAWNETAPYSGKNTGAAALFTNGEVHTGQRFDWTARWSEAADLAAVSKGIQTDWPKQPKGKPLRVEAVAYYGEPPSVKNLGILSQNTWGGPDTLIAVIKDDQIQIRTISDYMTDIHLSSSSKRPEKK